MMKMNNHKSFTWQDGLIIITSILSLVAYGAIYNTLPENIPSHWNAAGQINDTIHKAYYWGLMALPLGIYLLMKFLPKIDPKRKAYQIHAKAYQATLFAVYIMISVFSWIGVLTVKGFTFDVSRIALLSMGALFIVIGNFMPQIRQNYFFGIRTPWTLASEEVWKKTHRMGGYSFTIAGILAVSLGLFWKAQLLFIVFIIIGIASLIPTLYAYLLYRKLEKR